MLNFISLINIIILIYFIITALIYTVLLFGAFPMIVGYFNLKAYTNYEDIVENEDLPPVTVIIPMFNEIGLIKDALLSALNSNYKKFYVLLINDGSTDNSLEFLIEEFKLQEVPVIIDKKIKTKKVKRAFVSNDYLNLMVIDKERGGRGDALNVGVNICFTPYFFSMDADSVIAPTALANLMYEILIRRNGIAVGGSVYILNGCKVHDGKIEQSNLPRSYMAGIQSAEYLRSHLFSRTGWNILGGTMCYSGTATLYNREAVISVGGFDKDNYSQDCEIILNLHRRFREKKKPYTISFNPVAAVWTDVPSTFRAFAKQRDYWRRGLLRSVFSHMIMLFNSNYKIQGLIGFPVFLFLEILGPYVEFTAYFTVGLSYWYGVLNTISALLFIVLAWGFSSLITVANTFIGIITFNRYRRRSDILMMLAFATLETFGFRQYHVLINIYGTFRYAINRMKGKAL
ncbi:glycosyltransferase family 2 protein [Legionella oakridgensis]|uniref:glycosyltransferase family 2 protein n=1 Tax=Legionella oakridgensis TaxID=29423 RepID=UPI0003DE35F1|nr:glycosyltransferase [Legionella oakridgensis]ETO93658.1 glycosyltransferase, probably involved in cell wall biogenesis [Legionella oakridgensis RV-2-2007]